MEDVKDINTQIKNASSMPFLPHNTQFSKPLSGCSLERKVLLKKVVDTHCKISLTNEDHPHHPLHPNQVTVAAEKLGIRMGDLLKDVAGKQLDDFKAMYKEFDVDQNGHLTIEELDTLFQQKFGQYLQMAQLQELLKEIDKNHNGTVEWEEFVEMMSSPMVQQLMHDHDSLIGTNVASIANEESVEGTHPSAWGGLDLPLRMSSKVQKMIGDGPTALLPDTNSAGSEKLSSTFPGISPSTEHSRLKFPEAAIAVRAAARFAASVNPKASNAPPPKRVLQMKERLEEAVQVEATRGTSQMQRTLMDVVYTSVVKSIRSSSGKDFFRSELLRSTECLNEVLEESLHRLASDAFMCLSNEVWRSISGAKEVRARSVDHAKRLVAVGHVATMEAARDAMKAEISRFRQKDESRKEKEENIIKSQKKQEEQEQEIVLERAQWEKEKGELLVQLADKARLLEAMHSKLELKTRVCANLENKLESKDNQLKAATKKLADISERVKAAETAVASAHASKLEAEEMTEKIQHEAQSFSTKLHQSELNLKHAHATYVRCVVDTCRAEHRRLACPKSQTASDGRRFKTKSFLYAARGATTDSAEFDFPHSMWSTGSSTASTPLLVRHNSPPRSWREKAAILLGEDAAQLPPTLAPGVEVQQQYNDPCLPPAPLPKCPKQHLSKSQTNFPGGKFHHCHTSANADKYKVPVRVVNRMDIYK